MNVGDESSARPVPAANGQLVVLALLVAGLLGFLLLEGSLRLFRHQLLPVVSIAYAPCIYEPDEESKYRYVKNGRGWLHRNFEIDKPVIINSLGFHDAERGRPADHRSIAVVGDSFTAAIHVPMSETWTQVLEQNLPEGRFAEIVNLGIDGTGPREHQAVLRWYLEDNEPGHIVYAFYRNDIQDLQIGVPFRECYRGYIVRYKTEDQRNTILEYIDRNDPGPMVKWLHDNVYSFRLLARLVVPGSNLLRRNMVSPSFVGMEVEQVTDTSARLEDEILALKSLADSRNIGFSVLPMPAKHEPFSSIETLNEHLPPNMRANLHIIDIAPSLLALAEDEGLDYRDLFWAHDGHLNAQGNRLVGMVLASLLESQRLLDNS